MLNTCVHVKPGSTLQQTRVLDSAWVCLTDRADGGSPTLIIIYETSLVFLLFGEDFAVFLPQKFFKSVLCSVINDVWCILDLAWRRRRRRKGGKWVGLCWWTPLQCQDSSSSSSSMAAAAAITSASSFVIEIVGAVLSSAFFFLPGSLKPANTPLPAPPPFNFSNGEQPESRPDESAVEEGSGDPDHHPFIHAFSWCSSRRKRWNSMQLKNLFKREILLIRPWRFTPDLRTAASRKSAASAVETLLSAVSDGPQPLSYLLEDAAADGRGGRRSARVALSWRLSCREALQGVGKPPQPLLSYMLFPPLKYLCHHWR